VAINWPSFNIGPGEAVQFVQPNRNSVALNRVLGSDPSSIFGSLQANGQVFLVNPNGILFGKGAQVNVGGLVASILNIADADFMTGRYNFAGGSGATILNQGSINADGGYVALLGANVSNDGVISARLGTVAIAGGTAIVLDLAGDGLFSIAVSRGAANALIQNGGLILADGGQVLLTAQAAGNLIQGAVNNTGVIQAHSIGNRNGTIKLLGGLQNGTLNLSGLLDASAPEGGNGGFIETSAANVKVADSAIITTHSAQGKTGAWLIDPTDFTIAVAGGDITSIALARNLSTSNVTISSNDGLGGTSGDIHVNTSVQWAGATTLTLNAVHDVIVNAAVTADTAGARLVLTAGHDVNVTAPIHVVGAGASVVVSAVNDARVSAITGTAANTTIEVSAGHNLTTTGLINLVAADSSVRVSSGNDLFIGGPITATAANSTIKLIAGQDATVSAPIAAVAAGSLIDVAAGRDLTTTTTAAIAAVAATTSINLSAGRDMKVNSAIAAGAANSAVSMNAGHDINVNGAIAASAAGSSISMIAGLGGSGPGVAGGTVSITAAVASPNTIIRFNPDGYANTGTEISAYAAKVAGVVDAKAWVFAGGSNKIYDGTTAAVLALVGMPPEGGAVALIPGMASFLNKDVGTGKTINFDGYRIGGQDAGRFALFAGAGNTTADVTPRALTVTAPAVAKTYGQTPTLTAFTTLGLVGGETVGSVTETSPGTAATASVAGGPYPITPSSASGGTFAASNYAIVYVNGLLTVIPTDLTVTASAATMTYGQTPTLTAFTTTGLMNGETVGSVTGTSPGTAATASVAGGPYVITPGKASGGTFTASNYTIVYVNGALTVKPAGLTVTVADATKVFGQTPTLTGFTVVGLMNGETIDALTETSPGAAATASVAGSPYVITPGKASGGTFTASNYDILYVNGLLTVTPLIQSVPIAMASSMRDSSLTIANAVSPTWMPVVVRGEAPAELLTVVPSETPIVVPAQILPKI
jgi:filamentous hemagglutinin family protein